MSCKDNKCQEKIQAVHYTQMMEKRRLFVQNFTVPDLTDNLIENVESTTDTWDAMVDELRRRLAKRNAHSVDVAKRRAHNMVSEQIEEEETTDMDLTNHINQTNFQTSDIQLNDSSINALINTLNTDWKVGYKLWKNLTQQLQKQITDVRNTHLPPNSGGNNNTSKDNKKSVNFK